MTTQAIQSSLWSLFHIKNFWKPHGKSHCQTAALLLTTSQSLQERQDLVPKWLLKGTWKRLVTNIHRLPIKLPVPAGQMSTRPHIFLLLTRCLTARPGYATPKLDKDLKEFSVLMPPTLSSEPSTEMAQLHQSPRVTDITRTFLPINHILRGQSEQPYLSSSSGSLTELPSLTAYNSWLHLLTAVAERGSTGMPFQTCKSIGGYG